MILSMVVCVAMGFGLGYLFRMIDAAPGYSEEQVGVIGAECAALVDGDNSIAREAGYELRSEIERDVPGREAPWAGMFAAAAAYLRRAGADGKRAGAEEAADRAGR
jgi:hypothetical protein